jgi:uncharacterized repeat protein (TIGR01451 family)
MKTIHLPIKFVSAMICGILLGGCASQEEERGNDVQVMAISARPATPTPAGQPAAAPPPHASSTTAYFPSGKIEGSGLMIEKSAPAQVLAGQPFEYLYKVTNLTDASLENVMVMDRVTSNFTATDSDPKAANVANGIGTWNLGTFGPREVKTITVRGSAAEEGVITTCGWATYNPVVCQDIHVVTPRVTLVKSAPADVLICDPISAVLVVSNAGSSALTGVQITDNLPSGLTSDGKSTLTFDIGRLAPGESKQVTYNGTASTTGKLANTAKVTTAENVSAEASVTTAVHQPVLTITCQADQQQYIGRKFSVTYTVANTGDAPAAGARLEVPIPAGLQVADPGTGQSSGGNLAWDLGAIAPGAQATATATFTSTAAGTFDFAGTVKATCAAAVSANGQTKVIGVAGILLEKADDPDPIAVGETTTYTVKVTNQGFADDHNVQVVVTIPAELSPVSTTEGTIEGQTVTCPVVPTLGAKQSVTYKIVAKGVKAGDGHTNFRLSADVLSSPINAEESTTVY